MTKYLVIIAAMLLVACGDLNKEDNKQMGSEGGSCYPNKTCDEGLVCLSGVCVKLRADTDTLGSEDIDDESSDTSVSPDEETGDDSWIDVEGSFEDEDFSSTDTINNSDEDVLHTDIDNEENDSDILAVPCEEDVDCPTDKPTCDTVTGQCFAENSPGIDPEGCTECGGGESFGTYLGEYRQIASYSNGSNAGCPTPCNNYLELIDDSLSPVCGSRCSILSPQTEYGLAFQCVEYIQRFYGTVLEQNVFMSASGNACVKWNAFIGSKYQFSRFGNGAVTEMPRPDDLLVWYNKKDVCTDSSVGHVAIIMSVGSVDEDGNFDISIIQQNYKRTSADVNMVMKGKVGTNNIITISNPAGFSYYLMGWMRPPSHDWKNCRTDLPCPEPDKYDCVEDRCVEKTPCTNGDTRNDTPGTCDYADTCDESTSRTHLWQECVGNIWTDKNEEVPCTRDTDGTNCGTNSACDDGACVPNTHTYTCPAKPSTGTVWNTVSSYNQTWDGSAWVPADDPSTDYNTTASTTDCRYMCDTGDGYYWDVTISKCTKCGDGTKEGLEACEIGNSSTCSALGIGSVGTADCNSTCAGWVTTACQKTYTCAAKPAGTIWNNVSSYTQTWNGFEWVPADDPTTDYNTTASTTECRYKCDAGYTWNGSACALIPETCNGIDDDGNDRIDDAGSLQMSCMREIWRYKRAVDNKNVRLQFSVDYGNVPGIIADYDALSSSGYPGFIIYDTNVSGTTKLYYCVKNSSPYDNYYTTNSSDPICSGNYSTITTDTYIGYVLTSDPGSDKRYANWLYSGAYYYQPLKATGLYVMKYTSTGQHYFASSNQIAGLISSGWCCERGPSANCSGNYCSTQNTSPIGWIFMP